MMSLCCKLIDLLQGKTLATAESCTGGGIGAAITAVPGSSSVYVGGVVSYTNGVKQKLLGVDPGVLEEKGAVSPLVAEAMAMGVRSALEADIAVSVTGLAGPGGDDFGNLVGTVYIGYCDAMRCFSEKYIFSGDRVSVREQATRAALELVLRMNG